MPVQRLQEFLDEHQVKYVVISHSRAFTTQEIAAMTHIPGKELAKAVIVEIDDSLPWRCCRAPRGWTWTCSGTPSAPTR
jgi:prolyl-tRNA editing enzyme YbaK/EbsC (Cys-tRNA(Pro) deacylase)